MLSKTFVLSFFFTFSVAICQKLHDLNSNSFLRELFISGPFHSDEIVDPIDMIDFSYIEKEASFTNDSTLHPGVVIKSSDNVFDINSSLDDSAYAVAYCYFELYSEKRELAHFLLFTTDGAKLYINGSQEHAFAANTFHSIEEHIPVYLEKGINRCVLKIHNKDWDWKLKLKILNNKKGKDYLKKKYSAIEYYQFLNIDVVPLLNLKSDWTHNMMLYLRVGDFPEFTLNRPELAKKHLGGSYEIKVRWFDTDLNEIHYPKKTGRYGYYAEIIGANGDKIKRSGTLLCTTDNWTAWASFLNADLDYIPVNDISRETWKEHKDATGGFLGLNIFESFLTQKKEILFLVFLDDMNRKKFKSDKKRTPLIHDGDYHAKMKQIILGKRDYYQDLKLPSKISSQDDKLYYDKEYTISKHPNFIREMDSICQNWVNDGGSPFDMLIAKNGKIVYHDAFGVDAFGSFTISTPTEIASITKLFTGVLFAQFVDQGIIGIDDPVGIFLPEFPTNGPQAITMRNLFTHTAGTYGHGIFEGVHNHWLENTLYHAIKNDTSGTKYRYNGSSYELAGKVMELVTGKSVFRLFHEYLYEPLGMKNTYHEWSLGYSVHTTAYDLAIMGQMLLQRGIYDGRRYFSEQTFDKLLPVDLKQIYADISFTNSWDENQPRGIGIVMQNWQLNDENGKSRYLLSDNVIGHGSATSSVFRIDLENNIILTQSRRKGKSKFGEHFQKVYELIDNTWANYK